MTPRRQDYNKEIYCFAVAKTFLPQFKTFRSKCIEAFGKCRKYEDKVGEAVQNCGKKPTKVIQDLANALKTSASLEKVQVKVNTLKKKARRVVMCASRSENVRSLRAIAHRKGLADLSIIIQKVKLTLSKSGVSMAN